MLRGRRIVSATVIYTTALAVPFLLENAGEFGEYLPRPLRNGLEVIGAVYQRWSNGPRANEARYTAIVTLDEKNFPVLSEACKQRALVARLVPLLVEAGASEIVLDLAFTRSICPETEREHATGDLKAALTTAAAHVPVVIVQASRTLAQLRAAGRDVGRLRTAGFEENGLLLRPLIDLPFSDPQYQLSTGLMRLNQNTSKVPLSWTAYQEDGDKLSRIPSVKTLAFAAALAYRAPFPGGKAELDALASEGRHPFTTLLPRSKFIQVRAADLLCKGTGPDSLQPCPSGPPIAVKRQLNGRIVLLGWEDDPNDLDETGVGMLPGVFMQANFIESLLDSRCLHVISTSWQLGLSVAWFGLIELSFLLYRKSLEKALAGAILVFILGAFLFYYVAVVNLGFYLALLPPSFAAVLLRCWYQWFSMKERKAEPEGEGGSVMPPSLSNLKPPSKAGRERNQQVTGGQSFGNDSDKVEALNKIEEVP